MQIHHIKNNKKYKKADGERKQYERERMKYLEPQKNEKHLQQERNRIRTYRQKKKAEKTHTHTEEKPNSEIF